MEFNVDECFSTLAGDGTADKEDMQVNDHGDVVRVSAKDIVRNLDCQIETNGGNKDDLGGENRKEVNAPLLQNEKESSSQESCSENNECLENLHKITTLDDAANTSTKSNENLEEFDGQSEAASHLAVSPTHIPVVSSLNMSTPKYIIDVTDTINSDVPELENNCENSNVIPKVIKFCDICSSEKLEMNAISFCTTCIEYLCENCNRFHSKCKATKDHEVIVEKIPTDISVYKWMAKLMSCAQHPELKVTYFCHNHKIHVCLTCLVEAHRKCSNIQKLTNIVVFAKDKTKDITTNIETHLQLASTHIALRRKNIEDIAMEKDSILHSIGEQADSLIKDVLSLKAKAEQEVCQIAKAEVKSLKKDINLCTVLDDEEVMARKVIEFLAEENNGFDADVLRHIIWSKVRQHKETLSHLKAKSKHLHFIKNQTAIMTESFGNIKVYSIDVDVNQETSVSAQFDDRSFENDVDKNLNGPDQVLVPTIVSKLDSNECVGNSTSSLVESTTFRSTWSPSTLVCSEVPKAFTHPSGVLKSVFDFARPKPMLGSAQSLPDLNRLEPLSQKHKFVSETEKHSIRLDGDSSRCSVTKCIVLKNGSVALIDSANKKLKRFSHTFKTCFFMSLEGSVADICNPKGEEVAILYNGLHRIVVNELSSRTIATVRKLSLPDDQNYKCIAADKTNERFALIYDTKFGAHPKIYNHIQIRSYSGEVLCDFDLESLIGLDIEVPLNSKNCGICYTFKGLILVGVGLGVRCIPNECRKKDVVLSKSKILYSCSDEDMQGMTNRTCDIQGNIYICSSNLGGVVLQYNRSSNYRPTQVVSDILRPMSLDFLSNKKLVVGCKKDDFVHVYNFKNADK